MIGRTPMSLIISCPLRPTANELNASGTVPRQKPEPIGKVHSSSGSCIAYLRFKRMSPNPHLCDFLIVGLDQMRFTLEQSGLGTDDRSSCNPLPVARPAVCPRLRNGFELDASRSGRVGKSERRRRQSL